MIQWLPACTARTGGGRWGQKTRALPTVGAWMMTWICRLIF
ncbi:hypothetical protein HMPREF9163_02087 [Selenomonas sp. oral taxon 138 str. F0429]|nr:hypothetical protein HMPREF9163_02087 [Selenomonas sp. oral taxon 138 str. F0429]